VAISDTNEVKTGFLTIRGFDMVEKKFSMSVDELLRIINKFLKFYYPIEIDKEFVVEFCEKSQSPYKHMSRLLEVLIRFVKLFFWLTTIGTFLMYFLILGLGRNSLTNLFLLIFFTLLMSVFFIMTAVFDEKTEGQFSYFYQLPRISIYLRYIKKKNTLARIIAHELDHFVWFLEDKAFDYSKRYKKQPHEARAFEREKEFIKILQKSLI